MADFFSTTYCGPISYYSTLLQSNKVVIDKNEKWEKQSYRNRCYIDSPAGRLMLNIPIEHSSNKGSIAEVKISYREKWQHIHWQAFKTTYGASPFFEILAGELQEIILSEEKYLYKLNLRLLGYILKYLDAEEEVLLVSGNDEEKGLKHEFHPKIPDTKEFPVYPQVFDYKHGFLPDLTVLDLLFNEGPAAYDYLKML